MKKSIVIKVIFVALLWIVFITVKGAFYPVLINNSTINQLSDTATSNGNVELIKSVWNYYIPIILSCLSILVFKKEINVLIKGRETNEEN